MRICPKLAKFQAFENHNSHSFKDIKQHLQSLPLPNSSVISSEEVREGAREATALLMALVGARSIIPLDKSIFSDRLLKNLGNKTVNVNCRMMQRLGITEF